MCPLLVHWTDQDAQVADRGPLHPPLNIGGVLKPIPGLIWACLRSKDQLNFGEVQTRQFSDLRSRP